VSVRLPANLSKRRSSYKETIADPLGIAQRLAASFADG